MLKAGNMAKTHTVPTIINIETCESRAGRGLHPTRTPAIKIPSIGKGRRIRGDDKTQSKSDVHDTSTDTQTLNFIF